MDSDAAACLPAGGNGHAPEPDLGAFFKFCQTIQGYPRRDELINAVASLICRLLAAKAGIVLLKDLHTSAMAILAIATDDAQLERRLRAVRFPNVQAACGDPGPNAPFTGEAWLCFENLDTQISDMVTSQLVVPIRMQDSLIGALGALNKSNGEFTANDAQVLSAVAGVTATALAALSAGQKLATCERNTQALNQAKDHAAHHLSHAIKTPLSVLIASLTLLEKYLQASPLDGWQPICQRAQRNLERLLTIEYEVEDILRRRDEQER